MSYQNGKIYAIKNNINDETYYGSTIQPIIKRLKDHESAYKSWINSNKSDNCTSYKILKQGGYYIELIENYPCNNKQELQRREGEIIRLNNVNAVNKMIPGRMTPEEKKIYSRDYERKRKLDEKKYNESNNMIL